MQSNLTRPENELKAFCKVALAAGETKTVSFHLDKEAFWYYDPAKGGWIVEPGEFDIIAAASSRDLRLHARATLISSHPSRFHPGMTLREIMQDDAGKVIIRHHLAEWLTIPASYQYLDLTVEQILPHGYGMISTKIIEDLAADLNRA